MFLCNVHTVLFDSRIILKSISTICTLHQHIYDRSSLPLSISFALVHQFIFCLDLYSSFPFFAFAYEVDVAQYLSQSFKFLFVLKSIEQSNFLCIFLRNVGYEYAMQRQL